MDPHPARSRRWSETCLAAAGFLALSFVFSYPAGFSTTCTPLGSGDGTASYLPYMLRSFHPVSTDVSGPFDPTMFTGLPESHSPFGRYYPPCIVLYSLLPPALALGLLIVLHHAWAGLGTYLLVRGSGLSRAAAWLAGIVFAFGGFMIFHRGHVTMHQAGAWLPWVLWAFERFRLGHGLSWVVVAATCMAMGALPGHLQTIAMGGIVWVTYLVYFTVAGPGSRSEKREARSEKREAPGRLRFALGVCLGCVLGAIGSLPQVLPMKEVAGWSVYSKFEDSFFGNGNLKLRFLAGLVGPWVLGHNYGVERAAGYWGLFEHGIYHGVLPLLALIAGLVRRQAQGLQSPGSGATRFWLLLLVFSLLLMIGDNGPVHPFLAYVPVFNLFHIPARHVWIFGLALAWLAALGLDRFLAGSAAERWHVLKWTAVSFVALLAGCLLDAAWLCDWPTPKPTVSYPGFWVPVGCAAAALALLALLAWRGSEEKAVMALVPVFAFVELWLSVGSLGLYPIPADLLTRTESCPEVVQALRARHTEGGPPRCVIQQATWQLDGKPWLVPAGFGSTWGIGVVNPYSQSMPRSLCRLLCMGAYGNADFPRLLLEARGLSAAGVRYIVATDPEEPIAPGIGHQTACRDQLLWNGIPPSPAAGAELARSAEGQTSSLSAMALLQPGQHYLVHGELTSAEAVQGTVRVRIVHRISQRRSDTLAELTFGADDFRSGKLPFTQAFETRQAGGTFWIILEGTNTPPIQPARLDVWYLTPQFAESARALSGDTVWRLVQAGIRQPYPLLADYPGNIHLYDNPDARPLATLVREVRPAESDLDAAEKIVAAEKPVRELTYVVAQGGHSGDWKVDAPLRFETGTAAVHTSRPDDISVRTTTLGEGFLVLAVTRCAGWTATVDGTAIPIHAVDGPLMGVRVPAGEHVVRFRFRPVLVWAGLAAALVGLGGAWLGVLLHGLRRARRRKPEIVLNQSGGRLAA